MFLKHSIINGFRTHHFFNLCQKFPFKRLKNPRMFTGVDHTFSYSMNKAERGFGLLVKTTKSPQTRVVH